MTRKTEKNGTGVSMVRSARAGVFFGRIKSRKGQEVVLTDARRVWYWAGAASLSELATRGTSNPLMCKFPCPVSEVTLFEAIEILPVTDEALATLNSVAIWTA